MRTGDDPIERISEQVLAAAAAGDRDALTTIWRAANGAVLRYLRVRGVDAPAPVARAIWEEIARRLAHGGVSSPTAFAGELFTVAHELSDGAEGPSPNAERLDGTGGPHDEALAAIVTLPAAAAEVVYLRLVVELPDDVVANITGIEPNEVDAVLTRALATLIDRADSPFEEAR